MPVEINAARSEASTAEASVINLWPRKTSLSRG
jgi:hypothetical protein